MTIAHYVFPFVGAAFVEALYWFQLKERLHLEKYQRMLRSPVYWSVVAAFIVLSGLVAVAYGMSVTPAPSAIVMVAAGAGADALIKTAAGTLGAAKTAQLGAEHDDFALDDYFFPS